MRAVTSPLNAELISLASRSRSLIERGNTCLSAINTTATSKGQVARPETNWQRSVTATLPVVCVSSFGVCLAVRNRRMADAGHLILPEFSKRENLALPQLCVVRVLVSLGVETRFHTRS